MQKYKDFRPTAFDPRGLNAERYGIGEFLVVPVAHTRDSGALAQSNFQTALDRLGGESDDVQVHRFGHWGPGWFEIILINPNNPSKLKIAEGIVASLEDYPVLDDEDFSRREAKNAEEYWNNLPMRERIKTLADHKESIFAARCYGSQLYHRAENTYYYICSSVNE